MLKRKHICRSRAKTDLVGYQAKGSSFQGGGVRRAGGFERNLPLPPMAMPSSQKGLATVAGSREIGAAH